MEHIQPILIQFPLKMGWSAVISTLGAKPNYQRLLLTKQKKENIDKNTNYLLTFCQSKIIYVLYIRTELIL
jgi:hypothetical protein